MHLIHRVVFQNLECLQRFGLPRSMASNAELLANTEQELSSEQHALWWHVQLIKVALTKLSARIVLHAFAACRVPHALCCLLAACLTHAEHAYAVFASIMADHACAQTSRLSQVRSTNIARRTPGADWDAVLLRYFWTAA